jgi:hypothetical protein
MVIAAINHRIVIVGAGDGGHVGYATLKYNISIINSAPQI